MQAQSVERSFKKVLRYVSSVNQSRLKVVLDPVHEAAAAAMLWNVEPSRELLDKRFEDNLYFKYKAASSKLSWSIEDFDFSEARPELLSDRQRTIVHSFARGETSGFTVGAGFLSAFRNLPELGSFFGIWFTEELNHYWGYHRYLERMGEGWQLEKKQEVTAVEFLDYASDPYEVAAANMYQELIAFLVYSSFARQAKDPFLARMVATFAKDELRHYKFYEHVTAREIQRRPEFRKVVLKHFLKATTPMNQVSGGPSKVVDHLSLAGFYFRKREFDFLLKQNAYLFGDTFEQPFEFFYRRHLPPCGSCGLEVFRCACTQLEEAAALN
jgi:hypothetical protein